MQEQGPPSGAGERAGPVPGERAADLQLRGQGALQQPFADLPRDETLSGGVRGSCSHSGAETLRSLRG